MNEFGLGIYIFLSSNFAECCAGFMLRALSQDSSPAVQ